MLPTVLVRWTCATLFSINLYIGDYETIVLKTGQLFALPNQCVTQRPNVGIASEIGRALVSVMAAGLCTEKPSHGKYPCAAGTLHRETESWKIPMCCRNFAQRNRVMESTHVLQELWTYRSHSDCGFFRKLFSKIFLIKYDNVYAGMLVLLPLFEMNATYPTYQVVSSTDVCFIYDLFTQN